MENQHTVQCIIFDFGNVLAFFDRTITYRRIQALSSRNITLRQVEEAIKDDGLFHAYERGEVETGCYLDTIQQRLQIQLSHDDLEKAWVEILTPNRETLDLLEPLKHAGYRLVLGSNNNPMHHQQILRQFASLTDVFDAFVLSHETGVMKPDLRFFDYCTAACQCDPHNTLFIDDLKENVTAAQGYGYTTIRYLPGNNFIERLGHVGIEIGGER